MGITGTLSPAPPVIRKDKFLLSLIRGQAKPKAEERDGLLLGEYTCHVRLTTNKIEEIPMMISERDYAKELRLNPKK